jgi:RNA recognition motif-containing protein
MTRVRVGNLSGEATPLDLRARFAAYGPVTSAVISMDASNGKPERVGIVEMTFQAHAASAIDALDGAELTGSRMCVSRAAPSSDGGSRGNPPRGWDVARPGGGSDRNPRLRDGVPE